jgi:hypothetical protein
MASSIFGGIANAIDGGPKLDRIKYSSNLDDQLNLLTNSQTANRAANAADVARLSAAATGAAKQIEGLSAADQAVIQQIINSRVDPFSTYTGVGNYNLGLLNNLSAGLAEQGRAGESRRMAALGFGGRGGSTYGSNTLLDRISKNLAPVYAQTFGNIGRDATAIDSGRLNQNQNTLGLLDYRAGIPMRAVNAYGIPIQARQSVNDAEIRNLLGLGEGYKTNTAGFREKQTALGSIAGSLDSAVDTGLSLYTGGLAGGNNGPSRSQPTNIGFSQPPSGQSFGPSGYGGYGMSYSQPSKPGAWQPPWG